MSLPKLIFCENHYDPSVIKIITKIAPALRKLGYEVFLPEIAASWTVNDHIELLDFNEYTTKLLQSEKPVAQPSDALQMAQELSLKHAENKTTYNQMYKSFLQNLGEQKIDYVPIDVPRSSDNLNDYLSIEGIAKRDKRFVNAYRNEKRAGFGFIGAIHAAGMQRKILESQPLEEASTQFCFVHIFKEPPMNAAETALREGEIDHPLGLHVFDANKMSEDEIVDAILQQISTLENANQEQLGAKIQKEKHQRDLWLLRDTMYGYTGLFDNKEKKEEKNYGINKKGFKTKRNLIAAIEDVFGDNGSYQQRLLKIPDPKGEEYRRELMEFISKPKPYDVILDKLAILGRKAQRDHEDRTDFFSFFKSVFEQLELSCEFKRQTDELAELFKQEKPYERELKPINLSDFFEPKKDKENDCPQFNPGYRWG